MAPTGRFPKVRQTAANVIQRNNLSVGGSTYENAGHQLLDFTFYDTYKYLNTRPTFRMFTEGTSQGASPKSTFQTNMSIGGQLPKGQHFNAEFIMLQFNSCNVQDADPCTPSTGMTHAAITAFNKMLATTTLEIYIQNKDSQFTLPFQNIIGIRNLIQPSILTTKEQFELIPCNQFNGVYKLRTPVTLDANVSFWIQITHDSASMDTALNDLTVQVAMRGTLLRKI